MPEYTGYQDPELTAYQNERERLKEVIRNARCELTMLDVTEFQLTNAAALMQIQSLLDAMRIDRTTRTAAGLAMKWAVGNAIHTTETRREQHAADRAENLDRERKLQNAFPE